MILTDLASVLKPYLVKQLCIQARCWARVARPPEVELGSVVSNISRSTFLFCYFWYDVRNHQLYEHVQYLTLLTEW